MHGANLCFAFVAPDDVRLFQRKLVDPGKYLFILNCWGAGNFIKIHPTILIACKNKNLSRWKLDWEEVSEINTYRNKFNRRFDELIPNFQ